MSKLVNVIPARAARQRGAARSVWEALSLGGSRIDDEAIREHDGGGPVRARIHTGDVVAGSIESAEQQKSR